MSDELLYLIFIVVLVVAMFAYMMIRDKENQAKISKLENVLEDTNKNLHYLKKYLDEKSGISEEVLAQINVPNLDESKIKSLVEQELNSKIVQILKSLKGFESVIDELQSEQENRLSNLEQRTQNMTKLSPDYSSEEQKIVELFKAGKSVEQIAKDLRISTGNVEFALKFNKVID